MNDRLCKAMPTIALALTCLALGLFIGVTA
jgi:hypothetical protein